MACSVALGRPPPPPQVIYVTNYVLTTNFVFVSGVVTNYINTTNHLNVTNTFNNFTFTSVTNNIFTTVTNQDYVPATLSNLTVNGSLTINGTNGSVTTYQNGLVTGHLP